MNYLITSFTKKKKEKCYEQCKSCVCKHIYIYIYIYIYTEFSFDLFLNYTAYEIINNFIN